MVFDLIIIGASTAGASAGIYASRAGLNFIIISKDEEGNTATAGIVENYLGTISKSGFELSQEFKNHLKQYNPKIIIDEAKKINKQGNFFTVLTKNKKFKSKTIIIATGAKHRKLNIKGEKDFLNKGISYCETCDGAIFKDKTVAVIGGGNSAIKATYSLSKITKQIYVLNIENKFEAEKIYLDKIKKLSNVELISKAKTEEFIGNNFLKKLRYEDLKSKEKKELIIDGAFIYIGLIPNTELIEDNLKILNEEREIITDKLGKTAIDGLFAAGDVIDIPYKQISIASGSGAIALLSVLEHIGHN